MIFASFATNEVRPVEAVIFACVMTAFCIVLDPMLATAGSAIRACKILKERGAQNIRMICLLAAPEGIRNFQAELPEIPIFTAAVDSHLNDIGYIVPGLGDAGDRMFHTGL